jgi:hypothetical protein
VEGGGARGAALCGCVEDPAGVAGDRNARGVLLIVPVPRGCCCDGACPRAAPDAVGVEEEYVGGVGLGADACTDGGVALACCDVDAGVAGDRGDPRLCW